MNPTDAKKLQDFLDQLVQAQGVPKDPQAEALIERALARQPHAPYLLVQRALLLEQALANARARIADLESRGGGASAPGMLAAGVAGVAAGGFLFHGIGDLLGGDAADASSRLLATSAAQEWAAEAAEAGEAAGGRLDESPADDSTEDSLRGFFDGDGSDEGVFD